jgi:hypothetical protein
MPVNIIEPPLSQLDKLRQPLTEGEHLVLQYFLRNLGHDWEIYIQPHLNGLRPDFVLLNPHTGIAVFEVKDWDLTALKYYYKYVNGTPELFGSDGKHEFSLKKNDPVAKIELYKSVISSIFCPRLDSKDGFGLITGGIIFPFSNFSIVHQLLAPAREHHGHLKYPKLNTLLCKDDLTQGNTIKKALPCAFLKEDLRMSEKHASDLRHWLVEPEFSIEQRVSLMHGLDSRQRELVSTRPESRFRRIRGPAGSGKSVVLAARAAKLASEGSRVLLVTFNITLINYLLDFAVRYRQSGKVRNQIEAWNFHYWCKVVAGKTGHFEDYYRLWKSKDPIDVFATDLANSTTEWAKDLDSEDCYDAIFVDEGQDFRLEWWKALRQALASDGEMLLCSDKAQNIYGMSQAWTDNPAYGSGLSSRWVELRNSYRLPRPLCQLAAKFVETYLPDAENPRPLPPQGELDFGTEHLKWFQVEVGQEAEACTRALLDIVECSDPPIAISDLTLIVDSSSIGRLVIEQLFQQRGIRCIDTLEIEKENGLEQNNIGRKKKLAFFKGDARAKVTTMHSFKGWESRALVVLITHAHSNEDLSLIYAGITRLKCSERGSYLTVVCSTKRLSSFGEYWNQYQKNK